MGQPVEQRENSAMLYGMATRLYVRSGGTKQTWHIVRHPPQREDPIWAQRPALCGAMGTGSPWSSTGGWYEHAFSREGHPDGTVCGECDRQASVRR